MRPSRNPTAAFPQAQTAHDNFWDFIALTPESMHMIMWIMSDRAIPRSFRFMEGFGVHTFRLVNAKDESTFVKFHWKPKLGLQSVVWNEAREDQRRRSGLPPPRPLERHPERQFPGMGTAAPAVRPGSSPTNSTSTCSTRRSSSPKSWCRRSGRPPGAGPDAGQFLCRDRAGRVHDPERVAGHRLHQRSAAAGPQLLLSRHAAEAAGRPELHQIPINAPKCPFHISSRTAIWRCATRSGRANYEPNSFGEGPRENRLGQRFRRRLPNRARAPSCGCAPKVSPITTARRGSSTSARRAASRHHIAAALTFELSKVRTPVIRERMVSHLLNIDEGLAQGRELRSAWRRCRSRPMPRCRHGRILGLAGAEHRRQGPATLQGPQARHSRDRWRGCRRCSRR